ncbi:MAG: helix-turn-helix domain-containing protein [Planctomycetota bacterium]|jgi:plasmid maintenance system antidote protein VapI
MSKSAKASDVLRRAIADSGLTLTRLAELTGVDEGRLSRFVRGERTLTMPAADALCEVLGLQLVPRPKVGKPQKRRKKVKR